MENNGQRFVVYRSLAHPEWFELRLTMDGMMKCWRVRNGIPVDIQTRRIAVEEPPGPPSGKEPPGRATASPRSQGPAYPWDAGVWYSIGHADGYRLGHLKFCLRGLLLHGEWALVRMSDQGGVIRPPWLLLLISPSHAQV